MMNNVKAVAVSTDGNMKRLSISYDQVDEETGKVINSNARMNRIIAEEEVINAVNVIEAFAQKIVDEK